VIWIDCIAHPIASEVRVHIKRRVSSLLYIPLCVVLENEEPRPFTTASFGIL
jgi:hypothetical protein